MAAQNARKNKNIAILGSTGRIGSRIARELSGQGYEMRLPVRSLSHTLDVPGATSVEFVYGDTPLTRRALDGIDVLFMVSGRESATRLDEHKGLVDAAKAAGAKHIIYTSFQAVAPDSDFTLGRDHYFTEQYILESGLHYTFLRDSFYLEFFLDIVTDDGLILGPAGVDGGGCSAVAQADVAAVAAAILRDPDEHINKIYDMTGPEILSMKDAARIISEETGQTVTYKQETINEAYASRRAAYDVPDWELDAWVSTYTAFDSGVLANTHSDVESILGRPALTLRDVIRERKAKEESR